MELPEDIWSEILTRLSPKSLSRTLLTGKTFREEHLTKEAKRKIEGARVRTELAKVAKSTSSSVARTGILFYAVAPFLTRLLGPMIPHLGTKAIVTLSLLISWIQYYALLNDLGYDQIIIDNNLSALSGIITGRTWKLDDLALLILKKQGKVIQGSYLPDKVLSQLGYVETYLKEATFYLYEHPEDKDFFTV